MFALVAVVVMALLVCGCSSGVPTHASHVSNTGATLHGHVFSFQRDTDVQYWFKYGPTTAYGLLSSEQTVHIPVQQTEFVPVSAPVTGLTPFTTYHYQLCTAPPRGGCLQADKAFTAGPGLVFVSERAVAGGIWTMDAGGHDQRRLIDLAGGSTHPSVSPDGTKIAFASNLGGFALWLMDVDGDNRHPITDGTSFSDDPAWSPDGQKIAFTSNRGGNFDIYVMDADGGNETRLTNAVGLDFQPTWSPDGAKIAFTSARGGAATQIYAMDADGDNPTLLSDGSGEDFEPAWSPDGTKIAFSHDPPQSFQTQIWVMDRDGGNPAGLTGEALSDDQSPDWSPEGTRIAFARARGGDPHIYSMQTDGTHQTQLTDSPEVAGHPDWMPRP